MHDFWLRKTNWQLRKNLCCELRLDITYILMYFSGNLTLSSCTLKTKFLALCPDAMVCFSFIFVMSAFKHWDETFAIYNKWLVKVSNSQKNSLKLKLFSVLDINSHWCVWLHCLNNIVCFVSWAVLLYNSRNRNSLSGWRPGQFWQWCMMQTMLPWLHTIMSIGNTHREKLVILLSSVQKFIEMKGWLLLTFFIWLQNQLSYFYSIIVQMSEKCDLWNSKNEWLLLSVTFTAKSELVFVLIFENAFS